MSSHVSLELLLSPMRLLCALAGSNHEHLLESRLMPIVFYEPLHGTFSREGVVLGAGLCWLGWAGDFPLILALLEDLVPAISVVSLGHIPSEMTELGGHATPPSSAFPSTSPGVPRTS